MRPAIVAAAAFAAFGLSACEKLGQTEGGSPAAKGRYLGVGVFPTDRMWAQLQAPAPKDPAAATLKDDGQVIVVVDSVSGELRQCGNLSGVCITMNPWAAARPAARVVRHAEQLEAEDAAQARAEAAQARSARHRRRASPPGDVDAGSPARAGSESASGERGLARPTGSTLLKPEHDSAVR